MRKQQPEPKGVIPMESMLYSNYIQWDRMYHLTAQSFSYSNANSINVYIDMGSLISPLYYRFEEFNIKNYSVVTSSIINLCAHIRAYFESRHRVSTKIFIVYSPNCHSYNRSMYYGYNDKSYNNIQNNKVIREMVQTNLGMLNVLCQYLYDIYFISSNWESSVVMYDIMLQEQAKGNKNPSVIFTKDQYVYQIPSIMTQVAIYRPKKGGRDLNTGMVEDVSWAVTHNSVMQRFISEDRKIDPSKCEGLDPGLLSLLMTLSNCPSRGIKSIFNISTALKLLKQMVSEYQIQNGHSMMVGNVFDYLYENGKLKADNQLSKQLFVNRFSAIDILTQHQAYFASPDKVINYEINLYDPESVQAINNTHFKDCPLDLNRL